MESPRAQDIVADLRNDAFASAILDRVQAGPYVCLILNSTRCLAHHVFRASEVGSVMGNRPVKVSTPPSSMYLNTHRYETIDVPAGNLASRGKSFLKACSLGFYSFIF